MSKKDATCLTSRLRADKVGLSGKQPLSTCTDNPTLSARAWFIREKPTLSVKHVAFF